MKQIPLEQLHAAMMKDTHYRRLYESDQRSKAYEERKNLLRDLAEMVTLDRLRELVAAERDGRVVVLPCKVGDTVWYIADGKVESAELKAIRINVSAEMNGVLFEGIIPHGAYVYSWVIGQMLFLTRAEAEAKGERE